MRALVLDNLGVDCYGHQTFYLDILVLGDVSKGPISFHAG